MGKRTREEMDRDNALKKERYANDREWREKKLARQRERWANNPEYRKKKLARTRESIWRKKGMQFTIEQRDAMLSAQGGRCAICGTDKPGGRGAGTPITVMSPAGCGASSVTTAT